MHCSLAGFLRYVMADSFNTRESPAQNVACHLQLFSRLSFREYQAVFQQTVNAWIDDKAPRLGASLAFYTLLSLAPLLIVVVAVAALLYGQKAAQGQLVWEIQGLVGADGARAIQGLIHSAYKPGSGAIATILGVLTLIFGASSVVVELRDALNTIWRVPAPDAGSGFQSILRFMKERFYSFGLILGVGFLLMVSLILNAAIAAVGSYFGSFLPTPETLLHVIVFVMSFVVITCMFAAIYKFLPDVDLRWSDVIVGACFTSLLFTIGKQLIGLYLGKASFSSTYGAAGSLVVVLMWVYYSAQLFFLGAEFTKVYTEKFGSQFAATLQPSPVGPPGVIVDPSTGLPAGQRNPNIDVKLS